MALDSILEATVARASNVLEAEILATTLSSLVKRGPSDDESLSTNGLEVVQKVSRAFQVTLIPYEL